MRLIIKSLGILLMILSIICNYWIIGKLFSPDGVISDSKIKFTIFIMQLFIFLVGLSLIIVASTKINRIMKFISFNFLAVIFIILILEIFFGFINKYHNQGVISKLTYYDYKSGKKKDKPFVPDPFLGIKLNSNMVIKQMMSIDGKLIYDFEATIDGYHRRQTPNNRQAVKDNILFFGGSYTYGYSNDIETIPYYTSSCMNRYNAYNYGFAGWGPHHMLAKLRSGELSNEIQGKNRILIYTFLTHHINRVVGTFYEFVAYAKHHPYFIEDDGDIIFKGSMEKARPNLSYIYNIISKSNLIKYLKINFPILNDEHINLTFRIIEESKSEFREQYGGEKFIVIFYPVDPNDLNARNILNKLQDYLISHSIDYMDFRNIFDPTDKKYSLKDGNPGHPTSLANKIIADNICNSIKN